MQNSYSSRTQAPAMTDQAFAALGIDDLAYIREVFVNGAKAWAIISADGQSLAIAPDRDPAFAAAIQNDKTPLSVH